MCGVPHHSAKNYIEQLVERGYKVAICEQTEDPKQAKGVVRREVVQLITPGTMMEGRNLSDKENNYIATITVLGNNSYGFAYSDLSTGECKATKTIGFEATLNELSLSGAKELIISPDFPEESKKRLQERTTLTVSYEVEAEGLEQYEALLADVLDEELRLAVGRLFAYLYRTQKRNLDHLQPVAVYVIDDFMKIDYFSKRNLELTETIRSKGKKALYCGC